jgi:hypothetical protein
MPPSRQGIDGRWLKKHGNVLTKLEVVDGTDAQRVCLRVVNSGGSRFYKKGQIISMPASTLVFYYAPASR